MTRSALPTGPCGSSTPSLHDAINSAALVTEIARSHIADALGVLVASGDIRSGLATCITNSIGIHWRGWAWRGFCGNSTLFPIPPMGGLRKKPNWDHRATLWQRQRASAAFGCDARLVP